MIGGPVVLEADLDRDPRAQPGVTLEQDPGVHRRSVGGGRGRRRAAQAAVSEQARAAPTRRRAAIRRSVTGHGDSTCGDELAVPASTPGSPEKLRTATVARQAEPRSTAATRRLSYDAPQRSAFRDFPGHREPRGDAARLPLRPEGDRAPDPSVPRPPLRADAIGDLAAVVAPPYDVIGPDEHARLLARHPANVVRLDLPSAEPGDEPDERYRRAARTLAAWRSDGTLHKDPRSAVYVYEQTYRVPGTDVERTQRGFFGRLAARAVRAGRRGPAATSGRSTAPREDRYRLLRATGVNTSPVVGLYDDPSGTSSAVLATLAAGQPVADVRDDDGVRHRLWVVEADGPFGDRVAALTDAAGSGPVTIADGHHRYETALRYRDERRMSRSCEEDPAFDYLLMLLLETTAEPLTVLPTHRVVRGLGPDGVETLRAGLADLFEVRTASRSELLRDVRGRSRRGRRRPVRALDARRRRDPDRPPRGVRDGRRDRCRRRSRRSTPGSSARPWSAPRASTRRPSRAATDRLHEVRRGGDRLGRRRDRRRRRRVPARPDAGRGDRGRRPVGCASCPRSRPTSTRRP